MTGRKTVTLSVDGKLYELLRMQRTISPSKLWDLAAKAFLDAEGTMEYRELVAKKIMVEDLRKTYERRKKEVEREISGLELERREIEKVLEDLRVQKEKIEREIRLVRLEELIRELQKYARIYEYDVEEMRRDEVVMGVVREIKELRKDFDLEKFVHRMVGRWQI